MKIKMFCLLIFIVLVVHVSAQDTPANADSSKQFRFPKHALQFQIYNYLKFSDFNGAIFSGKYHFNNPNAIRLGLSYAGGYEDKEFEELYLPGDSIATDRSTKDNVQSVKVKFHFLRYISFSQSTKYFIGAGPTVSFYWSETEIDYDRSQAGYQFNDNRVKESKNREVGIEALNGVEWFFHPRMGLSLEYSFILRYNWQETITTIPSGDNTDKRQKKTSRAEGWRISSNPVKFGLSVYF